ncbi:MAG: preprotein translocase subunit SecA [Planctomycetota bacterium]
MPVSKIGEILVRIFGSRNERLIKGYSVIAQTAGRFESAVRELSDDQLRAKTDQFKAALAQGTKPEQILPEAFAVVREAARRNVVMRHFDVQLIGGNVLYQGKIAEMATGEGKTLAATLAAYLVYLTGRKVHVVTVNDYLAKRDAEWMGPIYNALGLTVGAIQADMDTVGDQRKQQYKCDITYGTNNEFGFDYLRDNMKLSLEQMVQGNLQYAIIDEVDSILIDEARTPLIISGPAFDDVTRYKKADSVARELLRMQSSYDHLKKQIEEAEHIIANARGELAEAKQQKDADRIEKALKVINKTEADLPHKKARLETMTQYYEVEYEHKAVHLTHEGIGAAQNIAAVGSFFTGSNMEWPHLLEQSLRAHITFEREKDYVVMDDKVVIVDEFTGRLMHGRQWSDGLHQAVEAKEAVTVKEETQTLATITLQNFFKLYGQIAGMTGTAATEAEEFMKIYGLDVITIPTNEPCIRQDQDDVIYKTMREKSAAIVDEIHEVSQSGQPVLVGTVSVEKNEALSQALTGKYGIEHEVLNAKHHAREATIVAKAGQQYTGRDGRMKGNVTISTNMAGRGTDIKLGPGVADIGGLHVIGTERHEARRIDNQLRGRSGRQGDAGSSQFFLSFDDDLLRIFTPDFMVKALTRVGWQEGEPIYHKWITRNIEKAQKKVEERNFERRKSLLEYDEVMDYQRKIFYSRRRTILSGRGLKQLVEKMIDSVITKNCDTILGKEYPLQCLCEWAGTTFKVDLQPADIMDLEPDEIEEIIKERGKNEAAAQITLSLGEYLENYEDPQTWDLQGLCKWAMSAFSVSLSAGKLKNETYQQIEEHLVNAAAEQIASKDCSQIRRFLKEDFALKTFADWARAKFDIKLEPDQLKQPTRQIDEYLRQKVAEKYKQREIEYPVEFAMNMIHGPAGENIYGFEELAAWANRKYNANLTASDIQNSKLSRIQKQLLDLSRSYNDGQLLEEINEHAQSLKGRDFLNWANQRFDTSINPDEFEQDDTDLRQIVEQAGREFLRKELTQLEKYVLLQIYDSTWKDHLYAMDHLKESIFLRAFAEKDPKVEYKQEGYRMFGEMLDTIEERVSDIIFKVRLEAGARARSVWNVSRTQHEQVDQFAMAERQRAAATAAQPGETKVRQIRLDQPKVGRNEPCPCGSGKKYKKCCGLNK